MHSLSTLRDSLSVFASKFLAALPWVLCQLHFANKRTKNSRVQTLALVEEHRRGRFSTRVRTIATLGIVMALSTVAAYPQVAVQPEQPAARQSTDLEQREQELQRQLDELKAQIQALRNAQSAASTTTARGEPTVDAKSEPPEQQASVRSSSTLPGGSTLNVLFDGYYEYNTNHPVGRANSLRSYDVLSNSFSLNQAAIVFELPTDVVKGRRFGTRLDLQFGQATATLQGNPVNENRPDIYRNIFQAYGRYVAPVGNGLTLDFGKWASSLGYEGNYTKDQLNYTRSFFFYYLPFYHMGIRTNYQFNDKVAVNYWLTNGTQQTEPFNSFKDEMFGFNLTPARSLTWTVNYYLGQEHPDAAPSSNCGSAPLQPGLCFTPIQSAPNGKTHIFDTYATWQVNPRLLFGGEADYVIQRLYANAAPGESSAPSHVLGGSAYAGYQFTPKTSIAARAEYLSDRNGLFSGTTQALKETTATMTHHLGDNFETLVEYRRDWSNRDFFPRGTAGVLVDHQDTATVGLVWWYGGKEGAW